jgi:hypothetical protein
MLIGNISKVYFWTSNTLHSSAFSKSKKDSFRISLRYLIKKKGIKKNLIDKMLIQNKVNNTRIDLTKSTKAHVEAEMREVLI